MTLPKSVVDREKQKFVEDSSGDVAIRTITSIGDIEIGAVEIKNATDDTRAVVSGSTPAGTENGLLVRIASFYTNANLGVSATDFDIRDLTSASDSVAAVQSGTWNITNVSGTVSLPTGAATSANQLADGHAVTIDNIISNEVYVRGSGTAGSADAAVLTIQGIASMTPLSVTESNPISGFATSALQLADGHNVTVDNATGAAVYVQPGTGATFTVSATNLDIRDLTSVSDSVAAAQSGTWIVGSNITGMGNGVTTVTTAGTDVVLAASTACKKVTIQAQTDNTGWIAVGIAGVDATEATGTGILLGSGDAYEMDIDNLADVYIDSTVNGEGVRYTYFT